MHPFSGEKTWDRTLERKAGGVKVSPELDLDFVSNLRVTSASSVMSLVRAVVGQIVRTGKIDESLCKDFASIKVTLVWCVLCASLCVVRCVCVAHAQACTSKHRRENR